jgi:hypothetical protein
VRILPAASKFSASQLHQLHQQIQALKLLTRGQSLSQSQLRHIQRLSEEELQTFDSFVQNNLIRVKWLQSLASQSGDFEQVPGDLSAKDAEFYCALRQGQLEEMLDGGIGLQEREKIETEIAMLELRELQASEREAIIDEWEMREETERDKSHMCLEVALLDREFYNRKLPVQDLRTKQEMKIAAKCEQAMRNGHEQKKSNKYNQFLADLLNHHREYFDFHRKKHVWHS